MLSAVILSGVATQHADYNYNNWSPLAEDTRSSRTRASSRSFLATADRDQTVSQRSKPSSRTTLIGEQPNPWDHLQPQDVMSRHRGAKQPRRFGLLGVISLLSLAYLLSVDRRPFRTASSGHYGRLSSLIDPSVFQSGELLPLRS